LINFGLFSLSDLEKHKLNQRTKTELTKILNRTKNFKPKNQAKSPKFDGSIQNQLNGSVCTPLVASMTQNFSIFFTSSYARRSKSNCILCDLPYGI
jgi:hypothetical protein